MNSNLVQQPGEVEELEGNLYGLAAQVQQNSWTAFRLRYSMLNCETMRNLDTLTEPEGM